MELEKTHILRITATIGEEEPTISMAAVRHAVAPGVAVDEGLHVSVGMRDGTEEFYRQGASLITERVRGFLDYRVDTSEVEHLSAFVFAPMPLVMLCGRTVGDKRSVATYERHRHTQSWRWDDDSSPLQWIVNFPPKPVPGRDVALLLSISANVSTESVMCAVDRAVDVVEITVPEPATNIVRTRAQLREFSRTWRLVLNRIKATYSASAVVHVFPAAPLSVCFECGRGFLPKADLDLIIYDYIDATFFRALTIRGVARPALGIVAVAEGDHERTLPSDWRVALHDFFIEGFGVRELGRWLDRLENDMSTHLPGEGTSPQDFVGIAIERLEKRGIVGDGMFKALEVHFTSPAKIAKVRSIAAAWRLAAAAAGSGQ